MSCIIVIDAPVYNTSSRIALKESYRLVVSCNAAADPLAKYQWLTHSGRVLSNSEILSIEAVSRGDSGVYFCTAANVAGTKRSANLTLDVQCESFKTFPVFQSHLGLAFCPHG